MVLASGIALVLFATVAGAVTIPVLEAHQSISTLSDEQVASYKPCTYYAGAAYCSPATTLAWSCGSVFIFNRWLTRSYALQSEM
jgi:hypothetical protein